MRLGTHAPGGALLRKTQAREIGMAGKTGIIVAIGVVLFIIVGVIGFYGSEASNAPEGDIVNYEEPEVEG